MPIYLMPIDAGRPIVIDKAILFVGRHPECDLVIAHSRKVSRKHCCIAQVDSRLVIRDLGSMNGIRINGERVRREAELQVGDEVTIGDVSYEVRDAQKAARREERRPQAGPRRAPPKPSMPADVSRDYPVPLPDEDAPAGRSDHHRNGNSDTDNRDSGNEAMLLSDDEH